MHSNVVYLFNVFVTGVELLIGIHKFVMYMM